MLGVSSLLCLSLLTLWCSSQVLPNRQGCNLNWSSKDQEQLIVPLYNCMIVNFLCVHLSSFVQTFSSFELLMLNLLNPVNHWHPKFGNCSSRKYYRLVKMYQNVHVVKCTGNSKMYWQSGATYLVLQRNCMREQIIEALLQSVAINC